MEDWAPYEYSEECATVRKSEKFTLTEKIFRQINSLVISLVKSYFHVMCAHWKLQKFTITQKKFRQINY